MRFVDALVWVLAFVMLAADVAACWAVLFSRWF
jgi:hypothetical protein